jgi:sugar lactone lactonase YvrE
VNNPGTQLLRGRELGTLVYFRLLYHVRLVAVSEPFPESLPKMRPLPVIIAVSILSCSAFGQAYTISTFAGGGLPINIAGTSASLGRASPFLAADPAGNVFFVYQNTILRLDAVTGILTLVAGNGARGFSGDDGPATSAQLDNPKGIVVDAAGDLYIADYGNFCIRRVSDGVITTVAGRGGSGLGDNGPATRAQLSSPYGVAVDAAGNLYIADVLDNRIREVSKGVITTVAGNGTKGFSGDNGPATSAQLSLPYSVAVDSGGNLYIADYINARIRKVSGGVISTVAGGGTSGFGDDGPATSSQLYNPVGIAVDSTGNLYIADIGICRVREVSGGVITTVAGNGRCGFGGENGPATSAQLYQPSGIAADSNGNLYIADSSNNRIRKVSGGVITTVAGDGTLSFSGDNGPATGAQLLWPTGVAVDPVGNLYVADGNNRIRMVSNGVITTVAGGGTSGLGDSGPATSTELSASTGVAVDSAGNFYIADNYNSRIRKVSNGMITTVAGNGRQGFSGDNGPAANAQIYNPFGVAIDSAGDLYIADLSNQRIRKVSNGMISTVAGNGARGFNGDDGPATNSPLYYPRSVAVDSMGNLYIADEFNNRVRKIYNGVITTAAGGGTSGLGDNGPATSAQLSGPYGVAADAAGNLYIADTNNNRIRRVSGGVITTVAGNGTQGFSGDGGPATSAQLYQPQGVAVDSAGNVYVADYGNHRIRLLTPVTSACTCAIDGGGQAFVAAGGNGTINITAGAGCPWTAASSATWVTITGGGTGTGNGTVTYQVAANSGAARSGVVTIANLSFTAEEASASVAGFTSGGSMAQLASAGYWTTTFTLVNTGSTPAQARLNFFDNNGNPLTLPLSFPQSTVAAGPLLAATLDRPLNPGAELVIQSTGPNSQPTLVGWAQLLTNGTIGGFAVLSQAIGNSVQDAEVPLENRNASGYVVPFDNTNGSATGVALANISAQAVNTAITIRDDTDAVILSDTIMLPAMGHTSYNLTDRYASTTGQRRGTLEFRTPAAGQISVLGLQFNATGAFSTIPAIAK